MADPTTVPTGIQPNLPAALSELGAALLLPALLVAVIAYFCGCFNGAVIVSKYILRDDVRTHGSGNAGLTNFYRTFGGPLTFVVPDRCAQSSRGCMGWHPGGKVFGGG